MKYAWKAPGSILLKLGYDEPLSDFAFKFDLSHHAMVDVHKRRSTPAHYGKLVLPASSQGRGDIENKHSTDLASKDRACAYVLRGPTPSTLIIEG
jgi:hypothetical protein